MDSTTNQTVLMVYDITERKRTELDLLQTKERFRMLVETSPMGLLLLVEGKVKYTNPGVLDLIGIRLEDEVYDEKFVALFHEDDQAVLEEDIRLVEQGDRPPYREVRLATPDKEFVEVGIRMTLSFHDRSPAVQVTLTDLRTRVALVREQMRATLAEEANLLLKEEIERHKKTQQMLANAERFNRSIIESSIDMIVAFDSEGYLAQYNHAFAVEFGLNVGDEPTQYGFRDFVANKDQADHIRNTLLEQFNFSGETEGKRLNGDVFPMNLTVAILRGDNDETLGAMAVGRDITEAKIAQEELLASEERYRSILDNANDAIFTLDDQGFSPTPTLRSTTCWGIPKRNCRSVRCTTSSRDCRSGGRVGSRRSRAPGRSENLWRPMAKHSPCSGGRRCRKTTPASRQGCVAFTWTSRT